MESKKKLYEQQPTNVKTLNSVLLRVDVRFAYILPSL